jgi:hypothetical protein
MTDAAGTTPSWQYLNLEDRPPWMVVALGLPGEHPDRYGDLFEPVASKTHKNRIRAMIRITSRRLAKSV